MKVGIIGVGYVGTACAKTMVLRESCQEVVLIDLPARDQHTRGVRNDLSHGASLFSSTRLTVGGYEEIKDAAVVVITAGVNEKRGGATNRRDPWGRQRLLPKNVGVYREVVPQIVRTAPQAMILVATDPPDTLADFAREIVAAEGGQNAVLSTGTYLDSCRLRVQVGDLLDCDPESVEASVVGEHGKTQVYGWSSARVGGIPLADLIAARGYPDLSAFRCLVESRVIDANIDIIEATEASQHGIGMVTSRIVEAILRNMRIVAPIGVWHEHYGVTLSLPTVIGRQVKALTMPHPATDLELAEGAAIRRSAAYLAEALQRVRDGANFDAPPSLTWDAWSDQLRTRRASFGSAEVV